MPSLDVTRGGSALLSLNTPVRILAWLGLGAIALATLVPIGLRPIVGIHADLERFSAFLLVAAVFALRSGALRLRSLVGLVSAAIALETLQTLTPDRHGHLWDLVVKLGGIIAGFAIGVLIRAIHVRVVARRKAS